jgi:hypothetical protein
MVVSVNLVAREYLSVAAGVPTAVDIPAFNATDISVYYGPLDELASTPLHYEIEMEDDFQTFTITPTEFLLEKITEWEVAGFADANRIVVRRELALLTEATPAGVRNTDFTSREMDRIAMRDQQLADELLRSIKLSKATAAPYPDLTIRSVPEAPGGQVVTWRAGGGFDFGPTAAELLAAADGVALAADVIERLDEFNTMYDTDYAGIYLAITGGVPPIDDDGPVPDFTAIYRGE